MPPRVAKKRAVSKRSVSTSAASSRNVDVGPPPCADSPATEVEETTSGKTDSSLRKEQTGKSDPIMIGESEMESNGAKEGDSSRPDPIIRARPAKKRAVARDEFERKDGSLLEKGTEIDKSEVLKDEKDCIVGEPSVEKLMEEVLEANAGEEKDVEGEKILKGGEESVENISGEREIEEEAVKEEIKDAEDKNENTEIEEPVNGGETEEPVEQEEPIKEEMEKGELVEEKPVKEVEPVIQEELVEDEEPIGKQLVDEGELVEEEPVDEGEPVEEGLVEEGEPIEEKLVEGEEEPAKEEEVEEVEGEEEPVEEEEEEEEPIEEEEYEEGEEVEEEEEPVEEEVEQGDGKEEYTRAKTSEEKRDVVAFEGKFLCNSFVNSSWVWWLLYSTFVNPRLICSSLADS